jgi:HEAT repeat protein
VTAALAITDIALAALIVALVVVLNLVRIRIRRRMRRQELLGPAMSRAVAKYAAVGGDLPRPAGRAEREILREAAMRTLFDLRDSARGQVVTLLQQLGYLDEAAAALRGRRRAVRRRAAEMLAVVSSPVVAPALLAGLSDRDPLVRTACARTLAAIGDEDVLPRVVAVARQDIAAAPGAAAAVVLAVGRRRPAALAPLLAPAVPAGVRLVAAAVAGGLRLSDLAPELRGCLGGGDDLAARAAQGLGRIGDLRSAPQLRELAGDPGKAPGPRSAAASALGAVGDAGSVPLLERLLLSPEWPVRAAAAGALAQLREPGADALRRAVQWGPPEARDQAEGALER